MFLDHVKISVTSGAGGNGLATFRREAFVEFGGPFGGSGGNGGSIIFVVDEGVRTLIDFRYQKQFIAPLGENGRSKVQHGKNGEDLMLRVPPGTIILNAVDGNVIADLKQHGDQKIIVTGGRGGRGNFELAKKGQGHLEICEKGEPGKKVELALELKLISDVGVIGLPSVGKSTFLAVTSAAKPKIAAYHFTTLIPNLGVIRTSDKRSFVAADLPGLIEGASSGKGLGQKFLKHIQRTQVLIHIVDMSGSEYRDPINDYEIIRNEIGSFDEKLLLRPEIIVANKKDLPDFDSNLAKFKIKYPELKIFECSTKANQGLDGVLLEAADLLESTAPLFAELNKKSRKIYTYEKVIPFHIEKDEDVFVITGAKIERLVAMTDFSKHDNLVRFLRQIKAMGIDAELAKMGIEDEDTVRISDFEFTHKE